MERKTVRETKGRVKLTSLGLEEQEAEKFKLRLLDKVYLAEYYNLR